MLGATRLWLPQRSALQMQRTQSLKHAAETPLKIGHLISALIKRKDIIPIKTKDKSTIEQMRKLRELWRGEWGDSHDSNIFHF